MILHPFRQRRRERLRAEPFPSAWRVMLETNFPIFRRLSPEDRAELVGHIQVFLAEKKFEGLGGLELTDEIQVIIAAQACLLLLHRQTDYYPELISILVYPSGYTVPGEHQLADNIWTDGGEDLLGHTQRRLGALVLAWDAARQGAADPGDGRNLVLHEFAHQLDFEDGITDGTPALDSREEYLTWARVMTTEFEALREADETGTPTILDRYGATNPAEFFAVVTEAFFERPQALRARHASLYTELQRFFRQDPASYSAESEPETRT